MHIIRCLQLIFQVILGKKITKNSISKIDTGMKVGDFVLTDIEKYQDEWPQLGKVIEVICPDTVILQWYKGSKTSSWSPCTIPVPGLRGKRQPFVEDVKVRDIWLSGFALTTNSFLTKSTKDAIDAY